MATRKRARARVYRRNYVTGVTHLHGNGDDADGDGAGRADSAYKAGALYDDRGAIDEKEI